MLGYGAAWACWWPRIFGIPVWINVDGLEWTRSKWGRIARVYLRVMEWASSWTGTRVIADAETIGDRFLRLYPGRAPCDCIAYGADVVEDGSQNADALDGWALVPYEYVLVVARPEPENHILEIIEGYLQYRGRWPLVIVGDISGATPYQRCLLEKACARIRFVGGVYDTGTLQCLRLYAAAYLHGHSVGGTNPSLLEALACGNWVMAHDNPFNREVARDAADYFQTPCQLAACLEDWELRANCERAARSARARQIVRTFYDWERITDAYECLMRQQCIQ
jgi:glycosyltransferase involved in cell wall biosynthesis